MPENDIHKLPRLYVDADLVRGGDVSLETPQVHYLRNVLRRQEGDFVRVFNGRDGEWLARLLTLGKKAGAVCPEERLRAQPEAGQERVVGLYFSPIKKQRMDMLIEKAVELGVTELHPVITRRSEVRKLNEERVRSQIIEAAEQCERMDIPVLHTLCNLEEALADLDTDTELYACIERCGETRPLGECKPGKNAAFLVGPEGGFEKGEVAEILACGKVIPVDLGRSILRAETAALACLSWARFEKRNDI